jgi:methane/ammonia monooxygenase subunit C
MAQMPALIPKEVEIQRLKKIYIMVIMLGSIAASVEVDNFVDGSLHQTTKSSVISNVVIPSSKCFVQIF